MVSSQMAHIAGKAFGNFHRLLNDFKVESLNEVIPNFHNTPVRIESLRKKVAKDSFDRLKNVKYEVEYLLERAAEFSKIIEMGKLGLIPKRVVHQDPKFGNLLLDTYEDSDVPEVLCVIGLDKVMPGYICYDFGEAIRYGANTGKEDDSNLDNVGLNYGMYRGFLDGFMEETRGFLTETEIKTLPFGPKLITYEQAVRFLDDYLAGDKYYKTNHPTHNLVRARAQIKLLQSMDELIKEN
jgi:Ser/Thr protein kinase RdoA (MazF antagonist)